MANPISIPDGTQSLHNIGAFIMEYEARQNAFVNALVNRIGRVLVTSRMWNNPLAVFKQGYLEMGETVEEIFVNIGKVYSFDPTDAQDTLYKREIPDVRAAFHTMNYQKFYPVTVSNDQLRQAFLSWQGITDLIAKIVDALYTAMKYDEFCVMKYMVCRDLLNGGLAIEDISTLNSETNYKAFITKARTYAANFEILSNKYNRAAVYNTAPKNEQYIIMPNAIAAAVDVEVLAAAFNMDKAEFMGHIIGVDSLSEHDKARLDLIFADDASYSFFSDDEVALLAKIAAVQLDKNWFMCFDNYEQMTQNYNGKGLYWNYFYHVWKTFSVSPYANAVAYYQGTTAVSAISVSPGTATIAPGGNTKFSATVTGTGIYDSTVVWSVATPVSDDTKIDPQSGVLYLGEDESAETLTVTATSIVDSTVTGTATVTVDSGD